MKPHAPSASHHRPPTKTLPQKLEHHLTAYALAAGAAAALLSAQSLAADTIVYTNSIQTLTESGTISVPSGPSVYFSIDHFQTLGSFAFNYGANLRFYAGQSWSPAPLAAGARIGPSNFNSSRRSTYGNPLFSVTRYFRHGNTFISSGYVNEVRGDWARYGSCSPCYTAFTFDFHGQPHYGWAEMNLSWSKLEPGVIGIELQLLASAYDRVPNASIIAGQTSNHSVPEPATLALLALGAAALPFWRSRKISTEKHKGNG